MLLIWRYVASFRYKTAFRGVSFSTAKKQEKALSGHIEKYDVTRRRETPFVKMWTEVAVKLFIDLDVAHYSLHNQYLPAYIFVTIFLLDNPLVNRSTIELYSLGAFSAVKAAYNKLK